MANRLSVAKVHSILTLHARGWSYRRIAKALGVDRETVRSHVHQARAPDSKPATAGQAPTGSCDEAPTGLAATDASGGSCGRLPGSPLEGGTGELGTPPREASACAPYREVILAKLEHGLSAVRIHQDLTSELGEAAPSYYSVRRYVHRLSGGHALPFRRLECEPGVEAQVDFGTGAPVVSAAHIVRIFDGRMQPIALHARKEEGRFSTHNSHILAEKINRVERGAAWLLGKVGCIGVPTRRWAEAMVQQRGIEGVRVLQGLLSLANKHSATEIDKACEMALSHQAWRLRTIRELIKRHETITAEQESFDGFIDEHPIIRSLTDYSQFVHDAFVQPSFN